jgi:hypothetical protein
MEFGVNMPAHVESAARRLYTNTTGGSSGKLGPFVGDVTQTFEGIRDLDAMGFSRRGVFTNAAQFGPLRTALRARCEAKTERRLSIVFEELAVSLFGFELQRKPFQARRLSPARSRNHSLRATAVRVLAPYPMSSIPPPSVTLRAAHVRSSFTRSS